MLWVFVLVVALSACTTQGCTDLRIVEILNRPASTATQYIQLFNSNRLHAIALNGLTLGHVSGGTSEIMSSDVIIPPLGCALLGSNNGSSNGNVKLDHVWSTFSLASTTTETIQLSLYSTTCTSVSIGTGASSWPTSTQGTSYVIRDYNLAPTGSNWELSPSAWTGSLTNKGSPGVCQQFSMAATRAAIITEFTPVASASVRPRSYIKLFNSATVSLNLANVKLRDENSLVNSFTAAAVLPPMSCSLLSGSSSTTTNGNITGYIATYDSVWWLYDGDTVRLSAAITPAELIGQSVSFTTGWPSRGTYASYILKDYRNTGDTASLWRAGTVSWPGSNAWSGGYTGYGEPYQCPYVQQSACSTIVITEFMYNPDMTDSFEAPGEYIKVMNKGSSSISMTGMYFNNQPILNPVVLSPGGCASFGGNSAGFNIYGVTFVDYLGFALQNTGMTVNISIGQPGNANYEVCTSITYTTSGAWPASADTNGKAFQLRHPTLDPALPNSWVLATTPVASTEGSNFGSPGCAARESASAASAASTSLASFALAATAASKASTSVASVASSAARAASTSLALAATAASTSLASGASFASKAATSLASIASLSAKAASESSASVASIENLVAHTSDASSELDVSSSNTEPGVSSPVAPSSVVNPPSSNPLSSSASSRLSSTAHRSSSASAHTTRAFIVPGDPNADKSSSSSAIPIAAGAGAGVVVLCIVILVLVVLYRKRQAKRKHQYDHRSNEPAQVESVHNPLFTASVSSSNLGTQGRTTRPSENIALQSMDPAYDDLHPKSVGRDSVVYASPAAVGKNKEHEALYEQITRPDGTRESMSSAGYAKPTSTLRKPSSSTEYASMPDAYAYGASPPVNSGVNYANLDMS